MEKGNSQIAAPNIDASVPRLGTKDVFMTYAKAASKRGLDVYFASKAGLLRAIGIVDFPVPPNSRLRRTSSHTIRHYYESGLTTMMPILTGARLANLDLDQPLNVLDFGCGVGRQLLQITRIYPNLHVFGCDANLDNIKYDKRAFPGADIYANSFDPPLQYGDDTFDLVYSVSTFSHFSMDDAKLWLTELRRVTKPGGILCLTINGFRSLSLLHDAGRGLHFTKEKLLEQGAWFDVDETGFYRNKAQDALTTFGSATSSVTRPTGDLYLSPAKAKEFFESVGLEFAGHAPGIIDRMQDLVVVRKK